MPEEPSWNLKYRPSGVSVRAFFGGELTEETDTSCIGYDVKGFVLDLEQTEEDMNDSVAYSIVPKDLKTT